MSIYPLIEDVAEEQTEPAIRDEMFSRLSKSMTAAKAGDEFAHRQAKFILKALELQLDHYAQQNGTTNAPTEDSTLSDQTER